MVARLLWLCCALSLLAGWLPALAATTQRTTIDAGGGKSANGIYSQRTSLGTPGGLAAVGTPAITARQGFIGQFFDVAGVVVSAASTNINEGAMQQLMATAQMDDGTFLAATLRVAWSASSGPISGVNASGMATAGAVYQTTPATVTARYLGFQATLGLNILDILPDNFGIYSADGIADLWQIQYFGTNNPSALSAVDPDGDGQNNLFEYTAGLEPTDPQSHFTVDVRKVPTLLDQVEQYAITFAPRLTDRTYVVETRYYLGPGYVFAPLTGDFGPITTNDMGQVRTVTDTLYYEVDQSYYRVRISKP